MSYIKAKNNYPSNVNNTTILNKYQLSSWPVNDNKFYGGRFFHNCSIISDKNKVSYTDKYSAPTYNESKIIRIREAENAFRNFKFDYYSFKFNSGYPNLFSYELCKENLLILHAYHSVFYARNLETDNYGIAKIENSNSCYSNDSTPTVIPTEPTTIPTEPTTTPTEPTTTTTEPTTTTTEPTTTTTPTVLCHNVTCPPGQTFDSISCSCVDPPICIDQTTCTPIPIPTDVEPTIYGYAFYVDSLKIIDIPNIGPVRVTCAGGHRCQKTLFRPKLIKSDSSTILADRNICLDNVPGGNDGSQIPVPGFIDQSGGERSDTFVFTLSNSSDIQNASVQIDCQYVGCHNGVTFIVLVAQDSITSEFKLIFSSCLLPSEIKDIGTIDCPGGDIICCDPQDPNCIPPTVTPPTVTPPPTFTTQPPTPTESTTTTTPTPTPTIPPDVSTDCCFCENIVSGTFTINTNPTSQYWENFVVPCGITEITSAGSTIINCNGTLYQVTWTPSGNFDSSNYEIYDATITPV